MRTGTRVHEVFLRLRFDRLFVGSEGTLGIITEIILKISPMPLSHKTALGMFSSLRDAGQAVSDIMHSGIIPSVLEIMDANSIRVLREIRAFLCRMPQP